MSRVRNDLTGQKFGKLTVIKLDEEETRKRKRTMFLCQCECGNTTVVRGSALKGSTIQSCG